LAAGGTIEIMDCKDCTELEQAFLETRRRWLRELRDGTLTPEKGDALSRDEWKMLLALIDHRVTQHCMNTMTDATNRALPAPRNMGGIIGPW
jgi:hypothetical protein